MSSLSLRLPLDQPATQEVSAERPNSSAYEVNVNAGVMTAKIDVVLFRQYFVNPVYEDTSPDASVVQAFAQEALAKIQGKPTTPPTTF